jgi:hypothetical protein
MYNPYLNFRGWNNNEYWSELDFPEFGKGQNLEAGLYNTFLNRNHQSRQFSTKALIPEWAARVLILRCTASGTLRI